MDAMYTAVATATGAGRDGHVTSEDGTLDLDIATPKEMNGSGDGTNPEQLFAAGYSACFLGALHVVARQEKAEIGDPTVTAEVDLGKVGQGFGLAVRLQVALPDVEDKAEAQRLVDRAHEVCPYSNATRDNIEVGVSVGD